ncbi:hypothetical protein TH61_07145 [Rufibacter sp. DG15C]|uniref:hypothetical protein n=1 Tax=Rufibacter sp. DG15C TaxID=1379909 RepID=UPI00078D1608|nr:hypothetical protein [Rufibacter sp. DG15C]AMM51003.1 hypothetical protein TH61_07145 [Rufibacter sp. DG15C]
MQSIIRIIIIVCLLAGCKDGKDYPEAIEVSKLGGTDLVPTLEQRIDRDKNQIYCSTFLYAWNEIKKNSKSVVIGPGFRQLRLINQSPLFKNSLAPEYIGNQLTFQGNSVIAKSEFAKSLPFELAFDKGNSKLIFGSTPVESFGFNGANQKAGSQAEILFYRNKDEFAIRLNTRAEDHEILLFTSPKLTGEALGDLIKVLNKEIKKSTKSKKLDKANWRYHFAEYDTLSVPIIAFNLEKNYHSIVGNMVAIDGQEFDVLKAYQRIALFLDHTGAKVESEAEIGLVTETVENLPKPKRLVFDKPFLMVFKRKSSKNPYLVAWIQNAELMIKK